jgi:hypothetical protein
LREIEAVANPSARENEPAGEPDVGYAVDFHRQHRLWQSQYRRRRRGSEHVGKRFGGLLTKIGM